MRIKQRLNTAVYCVQYCDNVGTGQGRTGEMNNGDDENMFNSMLGVNYADDDK